MRKTNPIPGEAGWGRGLRDAGRGLPCETNPISPPGADHLGFFLCSSPLRGFRSQSCKTNPISGSRDSPTIPIFH